MPYLTGDGVTTPLRYSIRLSFPQEEWFLAAVKGALSELTSVRNWQQNGVDTVQECVDAAVTMWQNMTLEGLHAMIGAIIPYATSSIPTNCLACDGSEYSKDDYPELYGVLDSAYIVNADTFRTPDLRGRAVVGNGQGTGLTNRAVGGIGGSERHQLVESEMPAHTHLYTPSPTLAATAPSAGFPFGNASAVPVATGSAGGGQSHENMPPFHALRYVIIAR